MTTVRIAALGDARRIARVHVRSWREGYADLMPANALKSRSLRDREALWNRVLAGAHQEMTVLVAESGETLEGFCSLQAPAGVEDRGAGSTAEITALYVDPDRWRRGVGGLLLREALDRLARDGWSEVVLWVLAGNDPALGLYAAFGFQPDGAVGTHRRSGLPQLRLTASLQAPG